jgi:hypothetical protein
MPIEASPDVYRMKPSETTGELEPLTSPEQHDNNREAVDVTDIPENNDDLLKEIEAENQRDAPRYFEVLRKLENLDQKQVEQIWAEVGDKFKENGIFTNHSAEGIDIFSEKSEWTSPYPINRLSQEEIQANFKREFVNIGGFYRDGNIFLHEEPDSQQREPTRDNLASLAAGYGLGEESDTFIHEIYHGFQDLDPEEVKKYQTETSEIKDKIKAIELEAKIKGQPAYKAVPLRGQLERMKKSLMELKNQRGPQSKDQLSDHAILKEIHSHMFSDPTRYRGEIKSYTEKGVGSAYTEMPIRRLYEKMIGTDRDNEDKKKICRYDYMEGKEDQAFTAFNQIGALRALGMNNLEIGRIISEDEYNSENGYYKKLQETIFQQRKQLGIDRDQHLKIIKRFQLSTIHKALKARNIVQDSLSDI